MSLPRIPAAAVAAGAALGRADTKDELEAIWISEGCDSFRAASRAYLISIYRSVCARIDRNAQSLKWARVS